MPGTIFPPRMLDSILIVLLIGHIVTTPPGGLDRIISSLPGKLLLLLLRRWTRRRPALVAVHIDDVGCWQCDEVLATGSSPIPHLAMAGFLCFYPALYLLFWALILSIAPDRGTGAE